MASDGFGILSIWYLKWGIYAIFLLQFTFITSQFDQLDCTRFHFVWSQFDHFDCSQSVQFICSHLHHYSYYLYLCHNKLTEYIPLCYFHPRFFHYGYRLALSTFSLLLMFATSSKCAVLCYRYGTHLSNFEWKLSICSRMPWFMACIYSISYFYTYTISFILLMVIYFDLHAYPYVECQNCLQHHYILTYPPSDFIYFQMCSKYFPHPNYHMYTKFPYIYIFCSTSKLNW